MVHGWNIPCGEPSLDPAVHDPQFHPEWAAHEALVPLVFCFMSRKRKEDYYQVNTVFTLTFILFNVNTIVNQLMY